MGYFIYRLFTFFLYFHSINHYFIYISFFNYSFFNPINIKFLYYIYLLCLSIVVVRLNPGHFNNIHV